MYLVIVVEPDWQLRDNGLRIGAGVHADIVALERANERLGHAVGLRAADRGRARDQPDVAGKVAGVASGVAAAPFDKLRTGLSVSHSIGAGTQFTWP